MASILDRYGIKEVCDFTFYEIDKNSGKPSKPVLYLDTLKVSTIEQTADTVDAKGGKGNVVLLSWDTNKEINVTLEDALFSAKSLAIMFGNGTLKDYSGASALIMKTETFTASGTESGSTTREKAISVGWTAKYEGPTGAQFEKLNPKFYTASGVEATTFADDESYFCTYDIAVEGSVVEVGANTFPGTYYCVGDTYARNAKSGEDEFFQFIIPKAKVQSENTINLEAEGDPSTFSMSLKVMKPDDGIMMKLVKYDAINGSTDTESTIADIDHNHDLSDTNTMTVSSKEVTIGTPEEVTITSGDTATCDKTTVATVAVEGTKLTITGVAAGKAVVTIKSSVGVTTQRIDVTVKAAG